MGTPATRHARTSWLTGCLLLLCAFFATPAWGATYYVDGKGGSDANTGILTAPFKTIIYAATKVAAAGDIVYVNPGDGTVASGYHYSSGKAGATNGIVLSVSGAAGNFIIFRGDGKDVNGTLWATSAWATALGGGAKPATYAQAVVDGGGTSGGAATYTGGFNITGSYNKVQYFEVTNTANSSTAAYGNPVYLSGSVGTVIDNCYLHDAGGVASDGVGLYNVSSSVTISNCTIGNASDASAVAAPGYDAIITDGTGCTNLTVVGCTITKIAPDVYTSSYRHHRGLLIQLNDTGATIANSVIHDNSLQSTNPGYAGAVIFDNGIANETARNNLIYGNTNAGSGFIEAIGFDIAGATGCVIEGNTVQASSGRAAGSVSGDIILRNNVFYTSDASNYNLLLTAAFTTGSSNCNVIYNSASATVVYYNGTGYTFSGYQTASSQDGQSIGADPKFVNSSSDFHLQSTFGSYHGGSTLTNDANDSPAICAGTPSTPLTSQVPAGAVTTISVVTTRGFPTASPNTIYLYDGTNKQSFSTTATNHSNYFTVSATASFTFNAWTTRVYFDDPTSSTFKGSVLSVNVTNGGSGYASAPTVSFSGGGSGATATATISGGAVSSVTVTAFGTGYDTTTAVSFSGGGGSGATATAFVSGADGLGSQLPDNGGRREIGCYGGSSQASLAGVNNGTAPASGVLATWVGGNVTTGTGKPSWSFTNAGETSTTTGWNDPFNWSTFAVPTTNDNVYVPERGTGVAPNNSYYADLDVASANCKNIEVSSYSNYWGSAGKLNLDSATAYTLTASGNVTIDAGTALTISNSSQILAIQGNYTNSGTLSHSAGKVQFTGTAGGNTLSGTLSGGSAFYNLEFAGSGGDWTPGATMLVTNDLTMTAGTLKDAGGYTFTVNGNVQGTAGIINLASGTFEQRVGAAKNFGTTSGVTAWTFNNLTFSNSAGSGQTVTTQTGGTGDLTINATLLIGKGSDTAGTTLNAGNRNWIITASGTGASRPFLIQTAPVATLTASTSTFRFTGSALTDINTATYDNLEVKPAAAVAHQFPSTITVSGNLIVGDGTNAGIADASVNNPAMTVSGNVTINTSGTLKASSSSTLTVGGSWSNSGTFNANSGTVTFNSTAAGNTLGGTMTGGSAFYVLNFNGSGGTWSLSNNATVSGTSANLVQNGTLKVNGQTLLLNGTGAAPGNQISGGTLEMDAGSYLQCANSVTLTVGSSGKLTTSGTGPGAGSFAVVQNSGAGNTYAVQINGTADVAYLTWAGVNASGVVIGVNATLSGSNNWTGVTFDNPTSGGTYLDFSAVTASTNMPLIMDQVRFNGGSTTHTHNIVEGGAAWTNPLTFTNYYVDPSFLNPATGTAEYGPNESPWPNTNDDIRWSENGVIRINGGVVQGTYATIQSAVNAAANNDIIEVRDGVVRTEVIDLSGKTLTNLTIDGAVLSPPSGSSFAVKGTGNTSYEILQNCVLIRPSGATYPLVWNVGRVLHCDMLGDPASAVLCQYDGGGTYWLWASILGKADAWSVVSNVLSLTSGTLNVYYSFLGGTRGGAGGTYNYSTAAPEYDQTTDPNLSFYKPSAGLYDVHLATSSTCIDYAPTAGGGAVPNASDVTTSLDRGTDFEASAGTPKPNPRRPITTPNAPAGGHGTYDVGAVEFGPVTATSFSGGSPQGGPQWAVQIGSGTDQWSDAIMSFDFATPVLYVGDNANLKVRALNMAVATGSIYTSSSINGMTLDDSGNGFAVPASVKRILYITYQLDSSVSTTDDLYLVVDTSSSTGTGNAILALKYDSVAATFSLNGGWGTNPISPATTGRMGRIVLDALNHLFVVQGALFFRISVTDGSYPAGANWGTVAQDNGISTNNHNTYRSNSNPGSSNAIFDIDGGMFSDRFNNIVEVPLIGGPHQIWACTVTNGNPSNTASPVSQPYERIDAGFNQVGNSIYITPTQTDYVVKLAVNNLSIAWQSADLQANVVTRAATLARSDAHVRVGGTHYVYKLLKSTGALASDSALSGASWSSDWGPTALRIRGNLLTTAFVTGSVALPAVAANDTADDSGTVMSFGTDWGDCYVMSYIRNKTGNAAGDKVGDYQYCDSGDTFEAKDGRPYPGFPYRIGGTKIVEVAQGYAVAPYNYTLLLFITDNGWVYAFPKPF